MRKVGGMSKKRIKFLGLLSNAGEGFHKINLPEPFRLVRWPRAKLIKTLGGFEGRSHCDIESTIFGDYSIADLPNGKCNVVVADFPEFESGEAADGQWAGNSDLFYDHLVNRLGWKLKLIRLAIECNLQLCISYIYEDKADDFYSSTHLSSPIYPSFLHLSDYQAIELNSFIAQINVPAHLDYLCLAFQFYDRSYGAQDLAHSFLLLMIAAEVLFNDSPGDTTFKICRGFGVLLAGGGNEGLSIYKEVKKLYGKRSRLVHSGSEREITENDVLVLRHYIRRAIIKLGRLSYEKSLFHESIVCGGMGDFSALGGSGLSRLERAFHWDGINIGVIEGFPNV